MRWKASPLSRAVLTVALVMVVASPTGATSPIAPTDLGALGSYGDIDYDLSSAYSVNASGQIVGDSIGFDSVGGTPASLASIWEPDGSGGFALTALPVLDGYTDCEALSINDAGRIMGHCTYWQSGDMVPQACIWTFDGSDWAVTGLGFLPDTAHDMSWAYGMDASGRVIGYSGEWETGLGAPYTWDDVEGMRPIVNLPPNPATEVVGVLELSWDSPISANGLVFGEMADNQGPYGAVIWDLSSRETRLFLPKADGGDVPYIDAISPSGKWFAGSNPELFIGTWDAGGDAVLASLGHPFPNEPDWNLVWLDMSTDAISDRGTIVGWGYAQWDTNGDGSQDASSGMQWLWSRCSPYTELSALLPEGVTGGIDVYSVSAWGQVPLELHDPEDYGQVSLYLWSGAGAAEEMDGLGGGWKSVWQVNDAGLAVGDSDLPGEYPPWHACAWSIDPPPGNQAPILDVSSAPATAQVGVPIAFTATATDPDCDMLTFSLGDDAPAGMSIDWSNGELTWTPASGGTFDFHVTVTDPGDEYDTETVSIGVSAFTVGDAAVTRNGKAITVRVPVTNTSAEIAYDLTMTAATLDGGTLTSRLPSVKNIRPGATKSMTVKFSASDTATGEQTLVVAGTSSLGGFSRTQTVTVP